MPRHRCSPRPTRAWAGLTRCKQLHNTTLAATLLTISVRRLPYKGFMARYLISPEVLIGIQPLASIPPSAFQPLIANLCAGLSVSFDIEAQLAKRLSQISAGFTPSDPDKLAEAFVGVHYLRLATDTDDELVQEVEEAWRESEFPDKVATVDTLVSNVRDLLQVRVLRASMKALSLITDHDKTFVGSRIFTDVRPVFDGDVDEPMLASLLIHTLKLTIREDGKPRSIYLVADSADLMELRKTIDRALEKAAALSTRINVSGGQLGPLLEYPKTVEDSE